MDDGQEGGGIFVVMFFVLFGNGFRFRLEKLGRGKLDRDLLVGTD